MDGRRVVDAVCSDREERVECRHHTQWMMGRALVGAFEGSRDRAGVVIPINGGWLGEGSRLSRSGIPTIGYISQPNYLLARPGDGCIEKLDASFMHSQIQVFAQLLHAIDAMSAEGLTAG